MSNERGDQIEIVEKLTVHPELNNFLHLWTRISNTLLYNEEVSGVIPQELRDATATADQIMKKIIKEHSLSEFVRLHADLDMELLPYQKLFEDNEMSTRT